MSMEITNNYSDYGKGYTNTAKEGECDNKHGGTENLDRGTKQSRSRRGTAMSHDYSKYLQGKYSYMNSGTTSMQGVPTTVSVSGAFLKKCMNDPEKAKVSGRKSGGIAGLRLLARIPCAGNTDEYFLGRLMQMGI